MIHSIHLAHAFNYIYYYGFHQKLESMIKVNRYIFLVFICIVNHLSLFSQQGNDTLINESLVFKLKKDTLFGSTGLKLWVGQKLNLGKPSGQGLRYRSIISLKAAIVPSIWGQNKKFDYAIENYTDDKKNKVKLQEILATSSSFVIQKIVFSKSAKPHFYMVILSSDAGACKADIKFALVQKELIVE